MWSVPFAFLAVVAVALAVPVMKSTTPGMEDQFSQTSTLASSRKIKSTTADIIKSTTASDLESTTSDMKTTRKHHTFKPLTFKPHTRRTKKPKTTRVMTTVTPVTHRMQTVTGKPVEKTTEFIKTTTELSHRRPVRQFSAGPGWQLSDISTTAKVSEMPEVSTLSTTFEPKHETTTTFLPKEDTTTHFDIEKTTTASLPTLSTTTEALHLRPVRQFPPGPGWQLSEASTTAKVIELPESTTLFTTIDSKNEITTPFTTTEFTNTHFDIEKNETTTTNLPTLFTTEAIPAIRHARNVFKAMPFDGPGWQMAEQPEHVNVDNKMIEKTTPFVDTTTILPESTSFSHESSTTSFFDDDTTTDFDSEEPGWVMDGAEGDDDDLEFTTGAFSSTGDFTIETTTLPIEDDKIRNPRGLGGDSWGLQETEEVSSLPVDSAPGWEMSQDDEVHPGWQLAETSSTALVGDETTTTLGDMTTTTLVGDITTTLSPSTSAFSLGGSEDDWSEVHTDMHEDLPEHMPTTDDMFEQDLPELMTSTTDALPDLGRRTTTARDDMIPEEQPHGGNGW